MSSDQRERVKVASANTSLSETDSAVEEWLITWWVWLVISIISVCLSLLYVHNNYPHLGTLLDHFSAVSLELSLVLIVVEKVLRRHEQQKEGRHRKEQLQLIKETMFRLELKDVYLADFQVLKEEYKGEDKDPGIRLSSIQCPIDIGLQDHYKTLKKWKEDFEKWKPKKTSELAGTSELVETSNLAGKLIERFDAATRGPSSDVKNRIIREYVKAERTWSWFKEFAVTYKMKEVLDDIIEIEHLIADDKAGKQNEIRLLKVWLNGIKKFVDYAEELARPGSKETHKLFNQMMKEYVEAERDHKEDEKKGSHRKEVEDLAGEVAEMMYKRLRTFN